MQNPFSLLSPFFQLVLSGCSAFALVKNHGDQLVSGFLFSLPSISFRFFFFLLSLFYSYHSFVPFSQYDRTRRKDRLQNFFLSKLHRTASE